MPDIESSREPIFKIEPETADQSLGQALPLKYRNQAIQEFDRESQGAEFKIMTPTTGDIAKWLKGGATLLACEDYAGAHKLFKSVLAKDPHNEEALAGRIRVLLAQGHNKEGFHALRELALVHSSFANWVWLADELYLADEIDEAYVCYIEAQQEPHVEGEVLFSVLKNMGNISLRKGDFQAAEENYNKAYTLNPESDTLLVNFGSLAIHLGQLETAISRFRQAVEINPQNEKAWIGLAMLHRDFGDSELAWANIVKALDINEGGPTAIKLVCEWAIKDNELERAISLIERYLKVRSGDAFLWMMQAKFQFLLVRVKDSYESIQNAIEIQPKDDDIRALYEIIEADYLNLGKRPSDRNDSL